VVHGHEQRAYSTIRLAVSKMKAERVRDLMIFIVLPRGHLHANVTRNCNGVQGGRGCAGNINLEWTPL